MLNPKPTHRKLEQAATSLPPRAANVIEFHMRVLPRHVAILTRWLQAGRTMGLCDASAFQSGRGDLGSVEPNTDYVLIWVRENADPAYMVTPAGSHWTVSDCVRQQVLGRLRSFEEALNFIRPVLGVSKAA